MIDFIAYSAVALVGMGVATTYGVLVRQHGLGTLEAKRAIASIVA